MGIGILFSLIGTAFSIYYYMVIAYIFMSWVPQMKDTPIGQLLEKLVEPLLAPFRRIIPPLGFIDISPMVALAALYFAKDGVLFLLSMLVNYIS